MSFRLTFFFAAAAASLLPVQAATIWALQSNGSLITLDSSTPGTVSAPIPVTGLVGGESVVGIDFRPATGQLYALTSGSRLYTINTGSGAALQVGSDGAFTLNGSFFGFDFNPVPDRIRVISNTTQNLRLNPNDGTLTATDGTLAYTPGDPNAGSSPNGVGSAYTNNFAGASSTTLYGIDSNLDILFTQNPPNNGTLNTVSALGFNTSDLVGFDIESGTGIAFASLTSPGDASSQLFLINLATGAATPLGVIGGGLLVHDISANLTVVPEPATWALLLVGLGLGCARRFRKNGN